MRGWVQPFTRTVGRPLSANSDCSADADVAAGRAGMGDQLRRISRESNQTAESSMTERLDF